MTNKLHNRLYYMPGEYTCPVCGKYHKIQKEVRKHFEREGAVGVECPGCKAIQYWYKIPDPRVKKDLRKKQVYWEEDAVPCHAEYPEEGATD